MKILFDYSIFNHQRLGGISRYFSNLDYEINKTTNESKILAPIHYNLFLKNYKNYKGFYIKRFPRFTTKLFKIYNNIITKKYIKNFKPEIFHKTFYNNFWPENFKGKKFLTVYDLIYEKFYKDYNFPSNYRPKKKALENSDGIFAISNNTKRDLMEFYDVPEKKIFVTHLGANLMMENVNNKIISDPFILFVGDRKRYKNFKNLLKAYALSQKINQSFKLVVFGGDDFYNDENKIIREYKLNEDKIIKVSGDDSLLVSFYKKAKLFVFPSKYEGFGLPLLEAAANDCPIVCSDLEVFKEIIKDGACYFNPYSVDDIIESLEKVLFSNTLTNDLRIKASKRLNNFSWKKCAEETLEIYKNLK